MRRTLFCCQHGQSITTGAIQLPSSVCHASSVLTGQPHPFSQPKLHKSLMTVRHLFTSAYLLVRQKDDAPGITAHLAWPEVSAVAVGAVLLDCGLWFWRSHQRVCRDWLGAWYLAPVHDFSVWHHAAVARLDGVQ